MCDPAFRILYFDLIEWVEAGLLHHWDEYCGYFFVAPILAIDTAVEGGSLTFKNPSTIDCSPSPEENCQSLLETINNAPGWSRNIFGEPPPED